MAEHIYRTILWRDSELDAAGALVEAWRRLDSHPNLSQSAYQAYLEEHPAAVPFVLGVTDDTGIRTIFVGRIEPAFVRLGRGPITLARMRARTLYAMHGGLLGESNPAIADVIAQQLLHAIAAGQVDRISFNLWPVDSDVVTAVKRLKCRYLMDWRPRLGVHRTMKLPDRPGELLKRMRSKHRSWFQRKARDVEALFNGHVEYRMVREPAELDAVFPLIEAVAARTYQRGLKAGFKDDPFTRKRCQAAAAEGRLRILLLMGEGKPQAFWVGFVYEDRFFSSSTGYRPEFRKYEMGNLVMIRLVDQLCAESVRCFDFGQGDAFYKERFGDACWTEVSFCLYRRGMRGLILNVLTSAPRMLADWLRAITDRLQIQQRVKKRWRLFLSLKARLLAPRPQDRQVGDKDDC